MYHRKCKLLIYSKNPILMDTLTKVPPPEKFEHYFDCASSFTNESLSLCAAANIIVLDLPPTEIPPNIGNHCKQKNAKKIFCSNEQDAPAIVESGLFGERDELWILPSGDGARPMIKYYFTKLLTQLKIEADLRLTRNYLETVIDSIPDLVWFKDLRGAHLNVNKSFSEAVGKTKEACENRGHYYIWDLNPEEYEKGEYVCLETEEIVLREKKTCLFDEQVKSQRGLRQFKTYKSPLFDEDGEVMGTVGIAQDVTDLQNLGEEFKIILESTNFAGAIVTETGQVKYVNRKFKEFFQNDNALLLDRDYFVWRKKVLPASENEDSLHTFEIELSLNGVDYFFEVNEEPLYDVFREKIGYFCIYQDISEHKRHLDLLENYQKRLEEDVRYKTKVLQNLQQQMIISFADIIASRDSVTGGHIRRTSKYVDIIVGVLKESGPYQELIDGSFIDHMSLAAPLHDIGKISISDKILNKPGKYLPEEYSIMKNHAALGGKILDKTISCLEDQKYYSLARNMAMYHHERWDGTGYPTFLKGAEIPLSARIMAVADVFDALVSKRPYKKPFPMDVAYQIIEDGSGTHFDPIVVDAFLKARPLIEDAF